MFFFFWYENGINWMKDYFYQLLLHARALQHAWLASALIHSWPPCSCNSKPFMPTPKAYVSKTKSVLIMSTDCQDSCLSLKLPLVGFGQTSQLRVLIESSVPRQNKQWPRNAISVYNGLILASILARRCDIRLHLFAVGADESECQNLIYRMRLWNNCSICCACCILFLLPQTIRQSRIW